MVVMVGACFLVVGVSVRGWPWSGGAWPPGGGRSSPGVEAGGERAAGRGLEDKLPLPQCYSSGAADPSIGAWRRCDGGAGECSPMGNKTMPDWMPQMESR